MVMSIERLDVPIAADEDGVVRVALTRVTLDSIVYAFEAGATAEEIVQQYPSLSLPSVYATIAYYLGHRDAVRDYLSERADQESRVRAMREAEPENAELRARLLARRIASG